MPTRLLQLSTDDAPSAAMDKRYRQFAFAKRGIRPFAFAKRFDSGSVRGFAFAKRSPSDELTLSDEPEEVEKRAR